MKQNLKIMSMLLGGLLVLGSLTACGSDSDDVPAQSPQPTRLKVDYSATVSEQLLDVATVTVRYIGENGQVASEQMVSTTWTKSVTMALPGKAGMNIQPTLKGSVGEGEYTLSAQGQMGYAWLDQDGAQLRTADAVRTRAFEAVFYADGLGQYLGTIATNCQLARTFAQDFTIADTTIEWGGNAGDDNTQNTGIDDSGATGDSM